VTDDWGVELPPDPVRPKRNRYKSVNNLLLFRLLRSIFSAFLQAITPWLIDLATLAAGGAFAWLKWWFLQ
jgi:hypothetical protein